MNKPISLITWGSSGGPFPRLIRWLADGLSKYDRRVDIIFLQDPKGIKKVNDKIREIGLGTRARYAVFPIMMYLRQYQPSFVLATPSHVAIPTLIAGSVSNVPVIPWEPTFLSYDEPYLPILMRVMTKAFRKSIYKLSSAVVATSSDVANEVKREIGLKSIYVLPNPCNIEAIKRTIGSQEKKNSKTCNLVAVSRLIYQKGVDVILKAIHILNNHGINNFKLTVLGDGQLRNELRELSKTLGVADKVNFLGYVSNPYPYMASSDVFVHASRWEGFGMVIVEAMALGLPVIATSCPGGPKEILDNGKYGYIVPPDDPEKLAEAIAHLINNPKERDRLRSLSLVRIQDYKPEIIAQKLLDIEKEIIIGRT